MLTAIVIALAGVTVVLDLLPGIKQRPKKESIIYCLLFAVGFSVLLLYSLGVKVPGPSELIRNVVQALFPAK